MSAYILVVDDEPCVAALVCQQLRRDLRPLRFQMELVPSGPAALVRAVEVKHRWLMLSDINNPGISGLYTRSAVRSKRPGLPLMKITACGGAKTRRKAPASGAERRPTKRNDVLLLRPKIETRLGHAA